MISKDKVVSFTYSILDQNGEVAAQSDIPMEYLHGETHSNMFPTVEKALAGKRAGDRVEVKLPPQDGYGYKDPNLIFTTEIENAPPECRYVGAKSALQSESGNMIEITVTHLDNKTITVDANHPLAGQTVTFCITVVGIRDATENDKAYGVSNQFGLMPSS